MKDTSKRDKETITRFTFENHRLSLENFQLREMLRNLYAVVSEANVGNDAQHKANEIMHRDHFLSKQIPVHGHIKNETIDN